MSDAEQNPSAIYCDVCDVSISGENNFNVHILGKKHVKRYQAHQAAKEGKSQISGEYYLDELDDAKTTYTSGNGNEHPWAAMMNSLYEKAEEEKDDSKDVLPLKKNNDSNDNSYNHKTVESENNKKKADQSGNQKRVEEKSQKKPPAMMLDDGDTNPWKAMMSMMQDEEGNLAHEYDEEEDDETVDQEEGELNAEDEAKSKQEQYQRHRKEVANYDKACSACGPKLRCTCCGEVYFDPVRLSCGHLIDRGCAEAKRQFGLIVTCPMCKKRIYCKDVDSLPTDNDIACQLPPPPCDPPDDDEGSDESDDDDGERRKRKKKKVKDKKKKARQRYGKGAEGEYDETDYDEWTNNYKKSYQSTHGSQNYTQRLQEQSYQRTDGEGSWSRPDYSSSQRSHPFSRADQYQRGQQTQQYQRQQQQQELHQLQQIQQRQQSIKPSPLMGIPSPFMGRRGFKLDDELDLKTDDFSKPQGFAAVRQAANLDMREFNPQEAYRSATVFPPAIKQFNPLMQSAQGPVVPQYNSTQGLSGVGSMHGGFQPPPGNAMSGSENRETYLRQLFAQQTEIVRAIEETRAAKVALSTTSSPVANATNTSSNNELLKQQTELQRLREEVEEQKRMLALQQKTLQEQLSLQQQQLALQKQQIEKPPVVKETLLPLPGDGQHAVSQNTTVDDSSSANPPVAAAPTKQQNSNQTAIEQVTQLYQQAFDLYQKAVKAASVDGAESASSKEAIKRYSEVYENLCALQNAAAGAAKGNIGGSSQTKDEFPASTNAKAESSHDDTGDSSALFGQPQQPIRAVKLEESNVDEPSPKRQRQDFDNSNRQENSSAVASAEELESSCYVLLMGLKVGIKATDIKDLCARYGRVVSIKIVGTRNTGTPQIFAYVTMENAHSATLTARNINGHTLRGCVIEAKKVKTTPFQKK